MKKIVLVLILAMTFIMMPKNASAKEDITIYLFRGSTCEHCEAALNYLNTHKEEMPDGVKFLTYEVWAKNNVGKNNSKLLDKMGSKLGLGKNSIGSVPLFIVGESYVLGYSTAADIEKVFDLVKKYQNEEEEYKDIVAEGIKELGIDVKSMTLSQIFSEPNKVATIIVYCVFGAIVLGFGAMILFSRKR